MTRVDRRTALKLGVAASASLGLGFWKEALAAPAVLEFLRSFILSGPVDRFWDTLYRRGLLLASTISGFCDRYVVDGLMNFIGWSTLAVGARVRALQTGRAPDYVMAVVLGAIVVVALGSIAAR